MVKSVLSLVRKCPKCNTSFIEEAGETCRCPEPMFPDEEPRVKDFEDAHEADQRSGTQS